MTDFENWKLLMLIHMVTSATVITNTVISIFIFCDGILAYPIVYFVVFGLQRLLFFIISCSNNFDKLILMEVFQLGFLQIFFKKKSDEQNYLDSTVMNLWIVQVPITIIQILFLYFINMNTVRESYLIIIYACLFIQITQSTLLFYIEIEHFRFMQYNWCIYQKRQTFISISTNIFSLLCMVKLQDYFGFNVGYYYLGLLAMNFVFSLLFLDRNNPGPQLINYGILNCNIYNKEFRKYELKHQKRIDIACYFNTIVRLILIIIFGWDSFYLKSFEFQDFLKLFSTTIAIVFSIAYFILFYDKLFTLLFKNIQQLALLNKQFSQNNPNYLILNITIEQNPQQNQEDIHEQLLNEKFCSQICLEKYKLQKKLFEFTSKGTTIQQTYPDNWICRCVEIEALSTLQTIPFYIVIEDIGQSYLKFSQILLERYFNSLISTPLTEDINKLIIAQDEKQILKKCLIDILQVNAFLKLCSPQMIFSSQQILYDLYSN